MKWEPLKNLKEFENFIMEQPELKLVKDPLGRVNNYQAYIINNVSNFTWYPETERLVIKNDPLKEVVVCLGNFKVVIGYDFEDKKTLQLGLSEKIAK